jgi:acetylornithine deacetylase/succinyl-diaminopimelate desuccinylase-like protein
MAPDTSDVFTAIDRRHGEFLDDLQQYLRIPSISTDPAYKNDIARCADFVRDRLEAAGLSARLIESAGHPLVYGEWLGAPGKPTLLFYGHYDVQPPDPLELWRHPPFEPTIEGKELVARGATDDKGQSHAHMAAVAAMLAARGRLPVNVKFLIEGEEESGGHAIESFVRADAGKQLACDAVVVSDSAMLGPGRPSLLYALRGIAYFEIEVVGPKIDLHSGTFGGVVQNPLHALSIILAGLKDPATGRILVPGFYDGVRDLEPWEREEMKAIAIDDAAMAKELGVPALAGETGFATRERIGGRPTCDVHGIWGGYQAAGAKTVLPSRAGAKFSMRLVPDQDPARIDEIVRRHVERAAPTGVTVTMKSHHGARPILIDAKGPLIEAAMDAMEDVWGRRPVRVREGGSIPVVATFVDVLRKPVLLLGFGLPDDRLHAPNEKLDLGQYKGGIRSTARLLDRVGALAHPESGREVR